MNTLINNLKTRNQKKSFAYFEPFIITIFWLLLFIAPIFIGSSENGYNWKHIYTTWLTLSPYLCLSLINRYLLLPHLFFKNKYLKFILINIVVIGLLAYASEQLIRIKTLQTNNITKDNFPRPDQRQFGPPGHNRQMPPPPQLQGQRPPSHRRGLPPPQNFPPYLNFALVSMLVIGLDTGLKLTVKWAQLEQQRMKTEKESMENQLAFLKNQVSPHFFMNTLNNIHSLIDIDTEEAKDSVIRLSKLMRHLLYDSEISLIPINKEIEFIKSYIDLMRLRFTDKIDIKLNIPDIIPECSIPPLMFTSYLENAFKHGISYQNESFIHVTLNFSESNLFFNIENSNHKVSSNDGASGIGMANSQKRLDLLFKENYELNITDTNETFGINLILPI